MSLNGLDDVKVKEAYDAAVAEPGGWFLLKYASRDEVDLLGRGNGGIVEIRNAIAQYEEASPLFGFLRYRRRNVIIKYVPEECSRLVQARVTVHFNAVTERFSPHDTVFSITAPKDLRDTTLSAACSLHTASGSTSSSTSSLRRRRLMEIAEDKEEEERVKRQSTVPEERPPTAKSLLVSGSQDPEVISSPPEDPSSSQSLTYRPKTAGGDTSPPPPRERTSIDEPKPRLSSQSIRPEIFRSYFDSKKPKVKLGPRPSLDVGGRPHTSAASSLYRPISTLPAGLKLFSRGSTKGRGRPKSQYPQETPETSSHQTPITETLALPTQDIPPRPHTSGGRPTTSSGASIKHLALPNTISGPKVPTITPEKARLMKALELRKKQMSAITNSTSPPATEGLQSSTSVIKETLVEAPQDGQEALENMNDVTKADDSGIAFDAVSAPKTDESDATRSDSYPTSPIGPSSKAESTRASSVSGSTDDTLQVASKSTDDHVDASNGLEGQATSLEHDLIPQPSPAAESAEPNVTIDIAPELSEVELGPTPAAATAPEVEVESSGTATTMSEVVLATGATIPEVEEEPAAAASAALIVPDVEVQPVSAPSVPDVELEPASAPTVPDVELESASAQTVPDVDVEPASAPTVPDVDVEPAAAPTVSNLEVQPRIVPEVATVETAAEPLAEVEPVIAVENSTVPELVPEPLPAVETAKESLIELPQLQAVTYEPPPFSILVPVLKPSKSAEAAHEESLGPGASDLAPSAAVDTDVQDEIEGSASANIKEPRLPETEVSSSTDYGCAIRSESYDVEASSSKALMQDLDTAGTITTLKSTSESQPRLDGLGISPAASTLASEIQDDAEHDGLTRKRTNRRGLIEPIRTDLDVNDGSVTNSEANFSSDDELMDELQSAVLQEAKPMSVSKSPISPVFPSPQKAIKESNRFSRAFSNPLRKDSSKPELLSAPEMSRPGTGRSVSASAAYLNRISQHVPAPMAKKINLGSGISQRIKALEQLSSTPGSSPVPSTSIPAPGPSPSFFSVRKSVVRPASRSPSIAERANSLTKNSPSNSRDSSPEAFKLRERSGSFQNRLDSLHTVTVPVNQTSRVRVETISVTARIIRDPSQPFPQMPEVGKDPTEFAPLDLKQSPLVIDHQKGTALPPPEPPKETIQERRLSNPRKKERRSSITIVKDIINEKRNSFSERRRSINLDLPAPSPALKTSSRPPSVHASPAFQRPMSVSSRKSVSSSAAVSPPPTAGSASSIDEKSDKKSNRASRILRRMSSSFSNSRKNISHAISPTLREDPEPVPHDIDSRSITSSYPSQSSMLHTPALSNVGDVNVQFPDSLLWKRRSIGLDPQGFLVLSPALTAHKAGDKANLGATRRFHLSEFKTPIIPEIEMQELPNSVVLDFVEGGGLQVACEDRAGQARVLGVLLEAHRSCTSQAT